MKTFAIYRATRIIIRKRKNSILYRKHIYYIHINLEISILGLTTLYNAVK